MGGGGVAVVGGGCGGCGCGALGGQMDHSWDHYHSSGSVVPLRQRDHRTRVNCLKGPQSRSYDNGRSCGPFGLASCECPWSLLPKGTTELHRPRALSGPWSLLPKG